MAEDLKIFFNLRISEMHLIYQFMICLEVIYIYFFNHNTLKLWRSDEYMVNSISRKLGKVKKSRMV